MRRGVVTFCLVLSMLLALPAQADEVGSAINNARGSGLAVDGSVDAFAQAAAERIAAGQSLVHSDLSGLLGPCTAAGEVIGFGPNVSSVMNAFAGSPGHRSTINQSKWNAMGTGAATDSLGVLWVAVVFCTLAAPAPVPAAPAAPAPAAPAPTPAAPRIQAPVAEPVVTAPVVPEPPALSTEVLRILGPFLTTDGTVSMVMGASPFLPEGEWRIFRFPSIN